VSDSVESRADLLLGGPLGRAMLAGLAGLDPLMLLAAAGMPPPAGVSFLEFSSSGGLGARRRRLRRRRDAHPDAGTWPKWMNPGGDGAPAIIGTAVASTLEESAERGGTPGPEALP